MLAGCWQSSSPPAETKQTSRPPLSTDRNGVASSSNSAESRQTAIESPRLPINERDAADLVQDPIKARPSQSQEPKPSEPMEDVSYASGLTSKDPVVNMNAQIERFNQEGRRLPFDSFTNRIEQRVSRIEHNQKEDVILCYDKQNKVFLTLKRQEDGRFKGTMEVKFEEVWKPEGHKWGSIIAEFILPMESFPPPASSTSSQ